MRVSATGSRFARGILATALSALLLTGCVSETRQTYLPQDAAIAAIDGFGAVRAYADTAPVLSFDADMARQKSRRELNVLMISGGGAGGAFGVGILSAWSKTGARPDFDIVTGVSTGALMAPLAFVGPRYDSDLIDLYTSGKARNLVEARWMGTGIFGASLLKAEPLRQMVNHYVTPRLLAEIAIEHAKGRRLFVMTTNLDSQRGVVWDLGAIAASRRPDAIKLFRDVLVASASVPGIFPSVMIKAKAGGRDIEEMHSDGGSVGQVLTLSDSLMSEPGKPALLDHEKVHIYVVVNNALMPEFATPDNKALSVAARAYATLIKSQTRQSLLALYGYAQRAGFDFHVASIDKQVPYSMLDPFSTRYMRSVYDLGYSRFMAGDLWRDRPVF